MSVKSNNSNEVRELFEKYLFHWKWYVLSFLFCVAIAFINLRYSTPKYNIEASISLKIILMKV